MFENLDALNAWLERRCIELWSELRHPQRREFTIRELWEQERGTLMAAPSAFDGFVEHTKRVSPTCLVHFDRNRYSVPATFANRPISLRVYADRLVMATEGKRLRSMSATSIDVMMEARPFMTGDITWQCCKENLGHFETVPRS